MVATSLENTYSRAVNLTLNKIRAVTYPLVLLLALGAVVACGPRDISNYLRGKEALLQGTWTKEEEETLKKNFKQNSTQYSQEIGNYIFARMYQESPEFALEFAQTPELNDGINPQEAEAMMCIYNLIKDLNIPPDLFAVEGLPLGTYQIIMEWRGNSDVKSNWSGYFISTGYAPISGKVLSVEPLGLEEGEDSINYEVVKKEADLEWSSYSNEGDSDGLTVTFTFPENDELRFHINVKLLSLNKSQFLSENKISFNEKDGLEGTLIIKNSTANLALEPYALKDMVLAGEGDHKFSVPLQALLWGYMDEKFKEGDNPFQNYEDIVEFVKPIWGDMKGPRWEKFEDVVGRLNSPQLILHYAQRNLPYDFESQKEILRWGTTQWKSPRQTFKLKKGNCNDQGRFALYCLLKNGYAYNGFTKNKPAATCLRAYVSKYKPGIGHVTCLYREGSGDFYIINLGKMFGNYEIKGPFKSIEEAASATYPNWKNYYFFNVDQRITHGPISRRKDN